MFNLLTHCLETKSVNYQDNTSCHSAFIGNKCDRLGVPVQVIDDNWQGGNERKYLSKMQDIVTRKIQCKIRFMLQDWTASERLKGRTGIIPKRSIRFRRKLNPRGSICNRAAAPSNASYKNDRNDRKWTGWFYRWRSVTFFSAEALVVRETKIDVLKRVFLVTRGRRGNIHDLRIYILNIAHWCLAIHALGREISDSLARKDERAHCSRCENNIWSFIRFTIPWGSPLKDIRVAGFLWYTTYAR